MFFLLRVAFWLSIVLVLMPSGDYQPKESGPSIGAADAVSAASAAMSDMSGFCERQPEACQVGGQAAIAFGQRAQAGAKFLFDLVTEKDKAADKAADKASDKDKRPLTTTGSIKTDRLPQPHNAQPTEPKPEWRGPLPPKDPRRPA